MDEEVQAALNNLQNMFDNMSGRLDDHDYRLGEIETFVNAHDAQSNVQPEESVVLDEDAPEFTPEPDPVVTQPETDDTTESNNDAA